MIAKKAARALLYITNEHACQALDACRYICRARFAESPRMLYFLNVSLDSLYPLAHKCDFMVVLFDIPKDISEGCMYFRYVMLRRHVLFQPGEMIIMFNGLQCKQIYLPIHLPHLCIDLVKTIIVFFEFFHDFF